MDDDLLVDEQVREGKQTKHGSEELGLTNLLLFGNPCLHEGLGIEEPSVPTWDPELLLP